MDEFRQLLEIRREPDDERGDYHTLAGFVLQRLGRIPVEGEQFEWRGLRFEVLVRPARERGPNPREAHGDGYPGN